MRTGSHIGCELNHNHQEDAVFSKPIFETLPIALIAIGIMTILTMQTLVASIEGSLLILAACSMVIVRLLRHGTNNDVLEEM